MTPNELIDSVIVLRLMETDGIWKNEEGIHQAK